MTNVQQLAELTGWAGRGDPGVDWEHAQQELGMPVPADFRELGGRFPPGTFQGYLHIRPAPYALADLRDRSLDVLRLWRDDDPDEDDIRAMRFEEELLAREGIVPDYAPEPEVSFPFPLWPEPGGIFPWAEAAGIGTFFWLQASPEPGSWPVVWCHGENLEWEQFDGTCTDFLMALVTGQMDTGRLGAPVFPPPPRFDEWQEGHFIPEAGALPEQDVKEYIDIIRARVKESLGLGPEDDWPEHDLPG